MSGGIVYDLWALAFAATIGGIAGLVYALRAKHRGRSEDADARLIECHCRLVESPCDWAEHPEWGLV